MRKLLPILLLVAIKVTAQSDTTYYADSAYTPTGAGGNIIIVDDDNPDTACVTRNTIVTDYGFGLAIMAGRDAADEDSGNVNQSIVSGNSVICTDYDNGVHGGMDGYNLIGWKHNYFANMGYCIVTEGTVTTIHNGDLPIQCNIFKSPMYYGTTCEGQRNRQYYNNTYYAGRHMQGYLVHFANNTAPDSPITVPSDSAKFYNNIVYSVEDSVVMFVGEDCKASFESDYNVYYVESSLNNQPYFYVQGNTPSIVTWPQWQALGYDANSVVVDPNFIDTIDFIPTTPLQYGTDLGDDYDTGLDTSYSYTAGTYPDTTQQSGTWQVGAVLYSLGAYGGDYYVSADGDDNAAGTSIVTAWATPQKAFETAQAGDTVWFLDDGGIFYPADYETGHDIYHYNPPDGYGNVGTIGNPICYYAYPGDTPTIDFSLISVSTSNVGVYMDSVHNVRFKGLTFQNLPKAAVGPNAMTFDCYACSNLHFEEVSVKYGGGAAFRYFSGIGDNVNIVTDSTYFINCDAFWNRDSTANAGDGWKCDQDSGAYFYFQGCRAMFNSDDGFDVSGSAMRIIKDCWAFGNGWETGGNGNGFKIGAVRDSTTSPPIILFNNLSAYNHDVDENGGAGFGFPDGQVSDSTYYRSNARVYNNTAYKNDIGFEEYNNPLKTFRLNEYRNCIAYASTYIQDDIAIDVQIITYQYPEDHNTWDWESGGYSFVMTDTVTVTDADFTTVDSATAVTQMMAARGEDGSLPTITFMRLAATSDLIDMGTTYKWSEFEDYPGVGSQVYSGDSPDIGFDEYTQAAGVPQLSTNAVTRVRFNQGFTGAHIITDGGASITAKGICYSTQADPTTSDSTIVCGTGDVDFTQTITGLPRNTTIHVRAYATNSEGTSYGADESFTTSSFSEVRSPSGKRLRHGGKTLILR